MSSTRSLPVQGVAKNCSTLTLIHTSSRDIEIYHYLRKPRTGACKFLSIFVVNITVEPSSGLRADPISWPANSDERQPAHFVFPPPPLPWSPGNPDSNTLELVDYCKPVVLGISWAVGSLMLTLFTCSCQCVLLDAVGFGCRSQSPAKHPASYDCFWQRTSHFRAQVITAGCVFATS